MGYLVTNDFTTNDVLAHLAIRYYKGTGQILTSSTKTAQRQLEDRDYGLREGLSEAIALILTQERVKKFPLFGHHEMVMRWEVQKVFIDFQTEGNYPNDEETIALLVELNRLVDGQDGVIAQAHEENRRGKVLKGEIKPVPEDREWLEELRDAQLKKVSDLNQIAELLKPNGNV